MIYGEIRDPIHGNIDLDETETKIINTTEMQRLRYLKQLDTAYLIFPGANHSRFEHSLGTMQVTKELSEGVYKKVSNEFSYVGLLHDIGHGPFSHLTEFVMEEKLGKNHEQIGEEVIRNSEIKDIISNSTLSFDKIMSYFREADKIDIVGGVLGSDRIDYLMRDSHYTGVAYGIIDYERIKTQLVQYKGKVAITESGVSGAESILIARYFMHSNVYSHHAKIIAAIMLRNGIRAAIEESALDPKLLVRMDDEELITAMLGSGIKSVANAADRIKKRRLFKRAYYENINLDKEIEVHEISSQIEKAGFARDEFIVHLSMLGGAKDDIDVVDNKGDYIGKLTEISPLVRTLTQMIGGYRTLIVACDSPNIEKVGSIVRNYIG